MELLPTKPEPVYQCHWKEFNTHHARTLGGTSSERERYHSHGITHTNILDESSTTVDIIACLQRSLLPIVILDAQPEKNMINEVIYRLLRLLSMEIPDESKNTRVMYTQVTLTKFMNQCTATLTVKEKKVSCPVSEGHASRTLCPVELGHTLRRTCKLDSLTYEGLSL